MVLVVGMLAMAQLSKAQEKTERGPAIPGSKSKEGLTVRVYPNPVKDVLNVKADRQSYLTITNLLGQEIHRGGYQNQLQVGTWSSGIYLLKVESKGTTKTVKFIKE